MFSYIVPSIFQSPLFEDQIRRISKIETIDEIIIINNSTYSNQQIVFPTFEKVKIIKGSNTIFCNGGWNIGVENSKSEWVVLATEDIKFQAEIFNILNIEIPKYQSVGVIGLDSKSPYFSQTDDDISRSISDLELEKITSDRPWGFAFMTIMRKNNFIPIPDDLKHWYGDDFLYYNSRNRGNNNFLIKSNTFKFHTKESSLSKDVETQKRTKLDEINWNNKYKYLNS